MHLNNNNRVTRKERNKVGKKKPKFLISFLILTLVAFLLILVVNRNGTYPWGSDSYGHIYKANILYDSIKSGDLFLNYDPNWYNGLQPYRYWGPLVYYILAGLNFITNNMYNAYNLYMFIVFVFSGTAFLLWGYYLDRQGLGLTLGILWMIVPYNLELLFAQGNMPFSVSIWVIPYLVYYFYRGIKEDKIFNYIMISIIMALLALDHAMLTALTGVGLFIFSVIYSMFNKTYKKCFVLLTYAFLGIFISSIWLLPALKGGIVNQDKAAATEAMIFFATPLSESINPFFRFESRESYYFGLSFLLISIIGVLFSRRNEKTGFIVSILVLIGTTPTVMNLIAALPFGQLFWITRLTAIALCMTFVSIMLWKSLRKSIMILFIIIMVLDSSISIYTEAIHLPYKQDQANRIDIATNLAEQRVSMMDTSEFGSFPSYYTTYGENSKAQIFGWAWQGATTGKNIVELNEALESNAFYTMFDRNLELGADVVVVKKDKVKDFEELEMASNILNYEKISEDSESITYKYNVNGNFGTKVNYDGIAIGKYAPNISILFPNFITGNKQYLDDYTFEELTQYKTIYLSGIKYRNKNNAENLIRAVSANGNKIVIDVTGLDDEFLGIKTSTITLKNNYGEVYYKGEKVEFQDFPQDERDFSVRFLSSLPQVDESTKCIIGSRMISYLYEEGNISFIGLNIPYFARVTDDENAIRILEDVLGYRVNTLPQREVVPINIEYVGDKEIIIEGEEGTLVPIAALDAFKARCGNFEEYNNLVKLKTNKLTIEITYPYLKSGLIGSCVAIVLIVLLTITIKRKPHLIQEERRA
ncbi:MAG: 6-pyruvoyl-tetrahydropterin synthase-related protein [Clostridium sp.]